MWGEGRGIADGDVGGTAKTYSRDLNDSRDLRPDVDVLNNLNRSGRTGSYTSCAGEVHRLRRLDGDATHLARVVGKHDSVAHRQRDAFASLVQCIAEMLVSEISRKQDAVLTYVMYSTSAPKARTCSCACAMIAACQKRVRERPAMYHAYEQK